MINCPTCGNPRPDPDLSITAPYFSEDEATPLMQELTTLLRNKGARRFHSDFDGEKSLTVVGWLA